MVTLDKVGGQFTTNCAEFKGLSTDTKPTDNVPNGSTFYEMNTGKIFMFDEENETWIEQ